jgi:replicative DNA helicase
VAKSNLNYIKRLVGDLSDEDAADLAADLLNSYSGEDSNKAAEMNLKLMAEYTDEAQELYRNFGRMQGLSTGFKKLDGLTLGLTPGELVMVAGKTSRGKTTLALNIANRVALEGKNVLFVTLEMTHAEITQRMMFINDCTSDDLTDQYHEVSSRIVFQQTDELRWDSIDALMQKAKEDMNVDLVVIDHLHYFTRELKNVAEDLGRITKEFKKNAIRHKVPVMLISHVRKTGNDNEATMEDLRGSSYMAQDADIVLMVGRKEDDPKHTYVKIEKNRNRGYDYERNVAVLYTDKIKIMNDEPLNVPNFPITSQDLNEALDLDDAIPA